MKKIIFYTYLFFTSTLLGQDIDTAGCLEKPLPSYSSINCEVDTCLRFKSSCNFSYICFELYDRNANILTKIEQFENVSLEFLNKSINEKSFLRGKLGNYYYRISYKINSKDKLWTETNWIKFYHPLPTEEKIKSEIKNGE